MFYVDLYYMKISNILHLCLRLTVRAMTVGLYNIVVYSHCSKYVYNSCQIEVMAYSFKNFKITYLYTFLYFQFYYVCFCYFAMIPICTMYFVLYRLSAILDIVVWGVGGRGGYEALSMMQD